jgi:catechol-2,3-dioxygenase
MSSAEPPSIRVRGRNDASCLRTTGGQQGRSHAGADHGTHLAVYLSDPDGNDLELAWHRPFEQWRRYGSDDAPPNNGRLELDELLAHRR